MRLERLEISGFKSFSDRAELAFDHGVTAIVGPNGCGKSNVADAITWVLGEQSVKSLRGEKMEDVIFGGSDARKPGAAAEVRLKLSGLGAPVGGPDLNNVRASLGDLDGARACSRSRCGSGGSGEQRKRYAWPRSRQRPRSTQPLRRSSTSSAETWRSPAVCTDRVKASI